MNATTTPTADTLIRIDFDLIDRAARSVIEAESPETSMTTARARRAAEEYLHRVASRIAEDFTHHAYGPGVKLASIDDVIRDTP